MRAVNLIPSEQRRGAGGLAGRSGGIVYVVPGGLTVLVAMGVIYGFAVNSVADRQGQLTAVTQQVAATPAAAQALEPYVQFATVSAQKVQAVAALAEQRFNWPTAMQQLALALPNDVSFTSFGATTSGGSATPFSITGCANSQGEVPSILTNLAGVPGVTDVQLISSAVYPGIGYHGLSTKVNNHGPAKASEPATGTCPKLTFTVTLSYAASYTLPKVKLPQGSSTGAQTVSVTAGTTAPIIHTAGRQVAP